MYNQTRVVWYPDAKSAPVEVTTGVWNKDTRLPVVNERIKMHIITNTGVVEVDGWVTQVTWGLKLHDFLEPVLEVRSYESMIERLKD